MGYSRWIEVNVDCICHNLQEIKQLVGTETKVLAVVKANAYGHGSVGVAKALAYGGVDAFAVTTIEEGRELREAGVALPILVFAPMLPDQCDDMKRWQLTPSIDCEEALLAWQAAAGGGFHLKIDTGMHRVGAFPEEGLALAKQSKELPDVQMTGVYSHLATAQQSDVTAAKKQIAIFQKLLADMKAEGIDYGLAHLANSAGLIKFPEARFDMVRAGTILYGQYPAETPHVLDLQDPWQAKGRLVEVKTVPAGGAIGYGGDYRCKKEELVGVIPYGYADGFNVLASTRPATIQSTFRDILKALAKAAGKYGTVYVRVNGKSVPVVGRIGMQLTSVSLTGVVAKAGDEVAVPLRRTTANVAIPRVFTGALAEQLHLNTVEERELG
ncbi:MAG: alanine racemase [Peptococcaceae bacterium]|nr:alanine racemase [Peptococcaceae bacterium]